MPSWMMLLGTTFRQASVRRVHLLRAIAYTTPGVLLVLHLLLGLFVGLVVADMLGWSVPGGEWAIPALLLVYIVWLTAWWWLFIRRYLRLPHAPALALLLMFTSLLGTFTAGALLDTFGDGS
jgi:hypothetical protein